MPPGWYPTPQGPRFWDGRQWLAPPPNPHAELVTSPVLGWIIVAGGAVVAIGSFMPWASALGGLVSKSGIDGGDGWITLLLGLGVVGLGIAIGCKQGTLPLPIITAVLGLAATALAAFEVSDVHDRQLDTGAGLWIILIAGLLVLGSSVAGAFVRERRADGAPIARM